MKELKKTDVLDYITVIRLNFDGAYKTSGKEEFERLIQSWYNILKVYPKEVCDKAVERALKTSEFTPRIGTIVKEIEKICDTQEKSLEELWAEVESVFYKVNEDLWRLRFSVIESNGKSQGDNAKERIYDTFNSLSPELREYLQDVGGLISLAQMDEKTLAFEKKAFIKAIPTIKARLKICAELSNLLPETKILIK